MMFQCIRTVNKYADPYLAGEIVSSDDGRGEGTWNNYHPISASELNSSEIVGSACKRIVVNHENKVTLRRFDLDLLSQRRLHPRTSISIASIEHYIPFSTSSTQLVLTSTTWNTATHRAANSKPNFK
jgi:hypothetical protein